MGTYLHLFQTQEEFENQYNTSAYTEPWVSITEEGDCESFVGNVTVQEQDMGQFTFYYVSNHEEDIYIFRPGDKENITAVDTSVSPNTITASGITFIYNDSLYDKYSWVSKKFMCITENEIPSVGDSAIIFNGDGEPVDIQERNPQVGEVIELSETSSIEVVSVNGGELLNRVDYNKQLEPLTVHFIKDTEESDIEFDLPEDIIFTNTDDFINYSFSGIAGNRTFTHYCFGNYRPIEGQFRNDNAYSESYLHIVLNLYENNSKNLTQYATEENLGQPFLNAISEYLNTNRIINVWVFCNQAGA